jgi:predicted Zn-dependent protease
MPSPLRRLLHAVSIAVVAPLALQACATNPATGQKQLSLVGEGQEIAMGQQAARDVQASIGLYDDPELQSYVQQVGERLAAGSERPNLPWSFNVVDDASVNAFALPGGFIYVTRGILPYLNSEAELASVIGHEIGHVTARHSVSQMSKAQLANLGLGVGMILSPDLARYSNLASAGLNLLFLKYSRDDERQADDLGLRYILRQGYDPRPMQDVFTVLDRVSTLEGGGRLPAWLSSHPPPADRRTRIAAEIAQAPQSPDSTTLNRDVYLRHVDGIVFGENPREGFFEGSTFYHPDLQFRLDFPRGWTTRNQKQQVVGVSPRQDAVMVLTLTQESSLEVAARRFASQEQLRTGGFQRRSLNGLPAASSSFQANTESGVIEGIVVFLEHGGRVYQLIGYSPARIWGGYERTIGDALGSFAPADDPRILGVKPLRLELTRLSRPTTPVQLAGSSGAPVTAEILAIMNHVGVDEPLPAGATVKRVTGQPLP